MQMMTNIEISPVLLEMFNRDATLEKMIDKHLYLNRRYIDRDSLFSITLFLDEMMLKVRQYNDTRSGKNQLVTWLDKNREPIAKLDDYSLDIEKYIDCINDYKQRLISQFNIAKVDLATFLGQVIQKCEGQTDSVLTRLKNLGYRYSTRDYGFAVIENYGEFIVLTDINQFLDKETQLYVESHVIVYTDGQHYNIGELLAKPMVVCVTIVTDDNTRMYTSLHSNAFFLDNLIECKFKLEALPQQNKIVHKSATDILINLSNLIDKLALFKRMFADDEYTKFTSIKTTYSREVSRLKRLTYKLSNCYEKFCLDHELPDFIDLNRLIRALIKSLNNYKEMRLSYHKIDWFIHDALKKISKTRPLYGERKKGFIHGEETLAAVLQGLLELRLGNANLCVTQEELCGAGRTDLAVKFNSFDVSIIECKKVRNSDVRNSILVNKIKSGINQLYARYSKSARQLADFPTTLYLVLFWVDPNWENARKAVEESIKSYTKENGVDLEYIGGNGNHENTLTIEMSQESSGHHLSRKISVVIADLEDQISFNRLTNKSDNPIHRLT